VGMVEPSLSFGSAMEEKRSEKENIAG